jgi:hypothetical protein
LRHGPRKEALFMSAVSSNGALDVDAPVDDDDDDAVDYPDPDDLAFDEAPPVEGDDTIHALSTGGAA